jgi:hypothetical protein
VHDPRPGLDTELSVLSLNTELTYEASISFSPREPPPDEFVSMASLEFDSASSDTLVLLEAAMVSIYRNFPRSMGSVADLFSRTCESRRFQKLRRHDGNVDLARFKTIGFFSENLVIAESSKREMVRRVYASFNRKTREV